MKEYMIKLIDEEVESIKSEFDKLNNDIAKVKDNEQLYEMDFRRRILTSRYDGLISFVESLGK